MWSSCAQFSFLLMLNLLICLVTVLDPQILYQGLLSDCENNIPLKNDLDLSQEDLRAFHRKHYTNTAPSRTSSASAPQPSVTNSSPQKFDFTAGYNKIWTAVIELEEYFKLAQERFEHCDPIRWWAGWHAHFQTYLVWLQTFFQYKVSMLSLALNTILIIPLCCGSWTNIFRWARHHFSSSYKSEARDYPSPMLVEQCLHLARTTIRDIVVY